jgi:hypothetical protein
MGTGAAQSRCLKLAAAHDVIAGNPKSILRMYLLEGANARADRNIEIGIIELRGSDFGRTFSAGSEVEIRYALVCTRGVLEGRARTAPQEDRLCRC